MNSAQMHLALTHLPVVLTLAGMIILIVSLIIKNIAVTRVGLYVLIAAGLSALPVYFSGEGAEEMVENIPGVSEAIIEEHEDIAKLSLIAIIITAVAGLIGLMSFITQRFGKPVYIGVLLLSFIATGLLAQTAHLGGQIRHSEIRSGGTLANADQNGNEANFEELNNQEEDDD